MKRQISIFNPVIYYAWIVYESFTNTYSVVAEQIAKHYSNQNKTFVRVENTNPNELTQKQLEKLFNEQKEKEHKYFIYDFLP